MFMTRQQFILALSMAAFYLLAQLLTGTTVTVAALFTLAILFGTLSVFAGGGLRSAFGCLNAILIGKFLLFGIVVKCLVLEPADGSLHAPETTALVMALGFAGLFVGTAIQSRLSCPQVCSMKQAFSPQMFLSFAIVLFAVSYMAYFASLISSARGEGIQTGGWLGIARALGSLRSFAIVPPMLYLWRTQARSWMTHPVILALVTWSALVGIFSTGKQDAIEPLAFYVLVGFMRYGLRDIRLWSLVSAGVFYYTMIVFPYSQIVRHSGGREGTLAQRAEITKDTFWRMASDRDFRSASTERVSGASYFSQASLSPFSRLAMVGEADRLISATERQNAFTGWETILWGFKLLTPSILFPNKPVFEAGNYLGHIVGEVAPSDTTTQISYGIMANFYNAFSLPGVAIGTPLFFAAFYYWIRMFLGEARWNGQPTTSGLWFIWIVASFQHSIAESTLSGLIASLSFPFVIGVSYMGARWFCVFLPQNAAQTQI
jgi:hypothetical protein